MPATDLQLKEILARTGALPGHGLQFNVQLPGGEIIPADISPGNAATILLTGGASPSAESVITRSGSPDLTPTSLPPNLIRTNAGVTTPAIAANPPSAAPKPIPNSGSDTYQGVINGKTQTFTDFNAAQAAGAINIEPIPRQSYSANQTPNLPSLAGSVQMQTLKNNIANLRDEIKHGLAAGGKTAILQGLFEKYGVKTETDIASDLTTQILQTQKELRAIPENLKTRLQDVGITQPQLDKLVSVDSDKKRQILNDLLERRGVQQEKIQQALTFVRMFADTMFEDQAAQLQANKFDLEQKLGDYKDLHSDQRFLLEKAFDSQERKMVALSNLYKSGAPADIISRASQAATEGEVLNIAAPFYRQQEQIKTANAIGKGIADQMTGNKAHDLKLIKDSSLLYGIPENILRDAAEGARVNKTGNEIEISNINAQLTRVPSKDGYTNPDLYAKLRAFSKISPTEFDNRFGYLVNPKDKERLGFSNVNIFGKPTATVKSNVLSALAENQGARATVDMNLLESDINYFYWVKAQLGI